MAKNPRVTIITEIVRAVLNQITALVRSQQGQSAINWVQNNRPEIKKLIEQGLNISDGISISIQLNNDSGLHSAKGTTLKSDLKIVKKKKRLYDNAVKTQTRIKNQLAATGISADRKAILQSELATADATVTYTKNDYETKLQATKNEAYIYANLSLSILANYNKLYSKVHTT